MPAYWHFQKYACQLFGCECFFWGGGSETDPNGRRQILLNLLLKPKCWHLKEREAHVLVFLLPGVGLPRLEPEVGLLAWNGAAASAIGVPGSKPGQDFSQPDQPELFGLVGEPAAAVQVQLLLPLFRVFLGLLFQVHSPADGELRHRRELLMMKLQNVRSEAGLAKASSAVGSRLNFEFRADDLGLFP